MPLTDFAVRNAKPGPKPQKLSDGQGLYLSIQPNGSKYWRLKYRFGGKEKLLALGVYPAVTLAQARTRRDQAKAALADGRDPAVTRNEAKRAAKASAENSLESIAREWIDAQKNRWTARHVENVTSSLERDIFPSLGARPLAEITAPELLDVIRKIEKRGAHETAARALQRCGGVFRYGIATGRCSRNPAADLRGALVAPEKKHFASLGAIDLPEFLRKLKDYDGQHQTRHALRLLLLTFVRTTELRGAEWIEFDLEAAEPIWRIPGRRMKMKDDHLVPLSSQAVAILRQQHRLSGRGALVFPSERKAHKPMSENTMLFALYRMGYHSRATGHGFRTTASTILNEQGWTADAIERQLAHAPRDKVRGTYNQAEYLPERRRMMQAWADYLDALGHGAAQDRLSANVA